MLKDGKKNFFDEFLLFEKRDKRRKKITADVIKK
jgi:hypothetical protein